MIFAFSGNTLSIVLIATNLKSITVTVYDYLNHITSF